MGNKRKPSQQALDIHAETPVADLHIDMLLTNFLFGYDLEKRHKNKIPYSPLVNHTDFPRLKDVGVRIAGLGLVCAPLNALKKTRFKQIRSQINYLKGIVSRRPDEINILLDLGKLDEMEKNNGISCLLGIEGAHALCGDLGLVDTYYNMGVRYMTLAHFSGNEACNCPKGIYNNNAAGLTDFGRKLVDRIHELGMILDVAHTDRTAFFEAIERSKQPVIVSHTGFAGVYDHWRNIDDEQLEAVAKVGGVAGIMFSPHFLGGSNFRPLSDVADHIMHAVKVVGPEHVAIGSDLDGWLWTMPEGFSDVGDLPLITDDLLERGMSEADVKKILGENVDRVVKKCLQ